MEPRYAEFLAFARARHEIYRKRQQGLPKPWTDDPIFLEYSFTNVFRELDKTTIWYANNVRERYDGTPHVFMATILFRWFNRIATGEVLFNQSDLTVGGRDIATAYLEGQATIGDIEHSVKTALGDGPYTTGAYIITSPAGMNKLKGVLHCVDEINKKRAYWIDFFNGKQRLLEETWKRLKDEKHMGPFMAYEVITDLYHTYLLRDAPDIGTWCNPGPGAKRGLMRIHLGNSSVTERGVLVPWNSKECINMIYALMCWINESDQYDAAFWGKPMWDMRDVEHTLCEFDKYERVLTGLGKPRNKYRGTTYC